MYPEHILFKAMRRAYGFQEKGVDIVFSVPPTPPLSSYN